MNYPLVMTNIAMENDHFELGIIEHRHKLSNQLQAAMFPLRGSRKSGRIWSSKILQKYMPQLGHNHGNMEIS